MNPRSAVAALALVLAACTGAGVPSARPPTCAPQAPSASPSRTASECPTFSATTTPSSVQTAPPAASPTPSRRPTPTPTATTRPTPAPTPRPSVAAASQLVEHGDRASNLVALTFTMGGRAEPVVPIMEWLRDHRVPATIFVAGSVIDSPWTDVGRTTLAMMEAHPDLFEMASHGYNHPDMRTLSAAEIRAEISAVEDTLAARGARTARPLFRPPSGYWDAEVLSVAGSLGYPYTVLWDVDPIDWRTVENGGPTAEEIVTKVVTRAQGGSIVLLHLSGTQTLAALPGVVDGLRGRGLEPALVGDLLP